MPDLNSSLAKLFGGINNLKDANSLVEELHQVEESLYEISQPSLNERIKNKVSAPLYQFMQDWQEVYQPLPLEETRVFLEKLRHYILNLGVVKASLAITPEVEFTETLVREIEAFLKQKILIDIVVKPDLIAGAVFEYKGRFSDQTAQTKLEEVLSQLSSKIL